MKRGDAVLIANGRRDSAAIDKEQERATWLELNVDGDEQRAVKVDIGREEKNDGEGAIDAAVVVRVDFEVPERLAAGFVTDVGARL